jgi:hypothetical protein
MNTLSILQDKFRLILAAFRFKNRTEKSNKCFTFAPKIMLCWLLDVFWRGHTMFLYCTQIAKLGTTNLQTRRRFHLFPPCGGEFCIAADTSRIPADFSPTRWRSPGFPLRFSAHFRTLGGASRAFRPTCRRQFRENSPTPYALPVEKF